MTDHRITLTGIGRELRALGDGFREVRDLVAENTAAARRVEQQLEALARGTGR
jgi:hypothetical protein